jgi:hypothetical protein
MSTAEMNKRKRGYYNGRLAQPYEWEQPFPVPQTLDGLKQALAVASPEIVKRVLDDNLTILISFQSEYIQKILDLCDQFRIDHSLTGWSRDLALNLAQRHEPSFKKNQNIAYAKIFPEYEIDPQAPDADLNLAMALACKHVFKEPIPRKTRFKSGQPLSLFLAYICLRGHFERQNRQISDRHAVRILMDSKRLRSIIP